MRFPNCDQLIGIVDDQPESRPFARWRPSAPHGSEPDESHYYVVLGHHFTVTAISDFRSASYRLAVPPTLRKASLRKGEMFDDLGGHDGQHLGLPIGRRRLDALPARVA
jgi:hypothetical protein